MDNKEKDENSRFIEMTIAVIAGNYFYHDFSNDFDLVSILWIGGIFLAVHLYKKYKIGSKIKQIFVKHMKMGGGT